jgi:murein DD-endopeptidase MepM/ murein hydrolase activator NlpD
MKLLFKKNWYDSYVKTSDFREPRDGYIHSGNDYKGIKSNPGKVFLSGIVHKIKYSLDYYGTQVQIYTNPKYVGGVDDLLYHNYCHLDYVFTNIQIGNFVESGDQIGKLGNTGRCLTEYQLNGERIPGKYRRITPEEQANPNLNWSVHLHSSFWQIASSGEKTALLLHMEELGIITTDDYFYQWGKVFIRPEVIFRYFEIMQSKAE